MKEMEEGNHLFESTWLSTAIEQIDKKMINEYETIMRRKVTIPINKEIRRYEGSASMASLFHCILRV